MPTPPMIMPFIAGPKSATGYDAIGSAGVTAATWGHRGRGGMRQSDASGASHASEPAAPLEQPQLDQHADHEHPAQRPERPADVLRRHAADVDAEQAGHEP